MSRIHQVVRFVAAGCALLGIAVAASPGQTWDAGPVTDTPDQRTQWFRAVNWSTDALPGQGSTTLDTNQNITFTNQGVRIFYRNVAGSLDPGIGSFHAQAPSVQSYTFRLSKDELFPENTLTTIGANDSFFHDGAGTYIVNIDAGSRLRVGDPLDLFPPTGSANANLYGFDLDLDNDNPVEAITPFFQDQLDVYVTNILGSGGVDATSRLEGMTSIPGGGAIRAAIIDCAYPNANPMTDSPWRLGYSGGDFTFPRLSVFAPIIRNVGDWQFSSLGTSEPRFELWTTSLELYDDPATANDGRILLDAGTSFVTINATEGIAPRITLPSSSQLVYSLDTPNQVIDMPTGLFPESPTALIELTGAGSLLRPEDFDDPADGEYESDTTLTLHVSVDFGRVDIQTAVAAEGLAFDGAFVDFDARGELDIEAITPDVSNVLHLDFTEAESGVPCQPLRNRCVKYWADISLQPGFFEDYLLTLRNDVENQNPADQPAYYPPEAVYVCHERIIGHAPAQAGPDHVRLYANVNFDDPEVIHIAITRFGDFDADFDTDLIDFGRFQNAFRGEGGVTWFPLADYATPLAGEVPHAAASLTVSPADCDADLEDFRFMRARWHETQPVEFPDTPSWRVCTATDLPNDNEFDANGDPGSVVCGGPLHVRPASVPPLDSPNCGLNPLGCGPNDTCAVPCPWDDGVRNPDGIFQIRVVESTSGASCINVSPNTTVNYQIIGVLCDTNNDGLALWATDLDLVEPAGADQIPLSAASPGPAMGNFVSPQGINNPGGYGGTPILTTVTYPDEFLPGSLVQIGGAQNTIKNVVGNAPFPIGPVTANVGFTEVALATGSVTIPAGAPNGMYTLRLSNVLANVIVDGQIAADGEYFRTERADVGSVENLRIFVGTTSSIVSANPPLDNPYIVGTQPYRDVLDTGNGTPLTEGIGGAGTMSQGTPPNQVQYAPILVTFSATPVPAPSTSNIEVRCSYIDTTGPDTTACPGVSSVSGSGAGPYEITLTSPMPPGGCTSIMFAHTCAMLQYESLPGDVNMGGITNTQDLLAMVQALNNGTAAANPARYNLNRDAITNTQDLLRLTQLLNGTLTTQPWNGVALAACDGAPPCFVQQEPEGGGEGEGEGGSSSLMAAGGGSESLMSGGGGEGLSVQELEAVIAAIEAVCEEEAIESEECQSIIESLFGS